jgi:hypothetical protein
MKERRWLVGWRGRRGSFEVRAVKAANPWEAVRVVYEHADYCEQLEGTEWLRVCEWTAGCEKGFDESGLEGGLKWRD